MKVKKILLAASLCVLLASCDGLIEVIGGPPSSYLVTFDQETFDTERAAWLKQNRQSYVFTLTGNYASPTPVTTRIVVEAGTVAAYTALEAENRPVAPTITDIYSDLAEAVQKKRADYEAGKIAGARIVISYTADHHPYSIYSAISSTPEQHFVGGSYQEYIKDFSGVFKPDNGSVSGEYPIEFDGDELNKELTDWTTQGIDDYVFEIEYLDNKDMSKKIKCVVEGGKVTAAYNWNHDEWDPMGSWQMEEEQEHIFERLIGRNLGYIPVTIPGIYDYMEKEFELMKKRYEKGIFSNLILDSDETVAKIEVLYSSDGLHYPASIRFYAPIIWGDRHYYEMKISGFEAGVRPEDKQAWDEAHGDT
jgi:hypothetical protein